MWINEHTDFFYFNSDSGNYIDRGHDLFQYRNAGLITANHLGPTLYEQQIRGFATLENNPYPNLWDEESTSGNWRFYREGRVMYAVLLQGSVAGIELGITGVDYPDFDSFRSAVLANAGLSNDIFTTSKGVRISYEGEGINRYAVVQKPGESTFSQVIDPTKRIETFYGYGDQEQGRLIEWNNGNMKVSHHGKTCTYDFNSWVMHGDCSVTSSPPEQKTCSEWNPSAVCCDAGTDCQGSAYYLATDCSSPQVCCDGSCKRNCDLDCTVSDAHGCGGGECDSNKVHLTRTCQHPAECPESFCVYNSACGDPDPPDPDPPGNNETGGDNNSGGGNGGDTPILGDLNNDDIVDIFDLVLLVRSFGTSNNDLTNDGIVDVQDLLVIIQKL